MAEVATISRPYAEALFGALGHHSDAVVWLDALAAVAADPSLLEFSANPKVERGQVLALMTSVVQKPLPKEAVELLTVLLENGRLSALPEIVKQFKALSNARSGVADALVQSAFPMDSASLSELGSSLEKKFARKLNLTLEVDPGLIGGVRVVVGDEVLDTSVKARLEQMKAALTA